MGEQKAVAAAKTEGADQVQKSAVRALALAITISVSRELQKTCRFWL